MSRRRCAPFRVLIPLVLLALVTGCGAGRYPVTGRVTYEDGAPVDEGTVIGEATVDGTAVGVQGNIAKDGSYALGGNSAGDGALPGSYRILVMPRTLGDSEKAAGKVPGVDRKFSKYETSGLTYEVRPGKNEFNITVSRPKQKTEGN